MVQDINGEVEYVENAGVYEEQQTMFLKQVLPVSYIRGYREGQGQDMGGDLGVEHMSKRVKFVHESESNGQCDAVMAVFCGSSNQKPRLNDLVEIFGVLEDLTDVSDSVDDSMIVEIPCRDGKDSFVQLPRILVSSFERLELDTYNASISTFKSNSRIFNYGTDDRSVVIEGFAHHLFCGNTLAAEALLLALLSKAERENNYPFGNPVKIDSEGSSASVGCSALNLVLPNEADCLSFGRVLHQALQQLFPCASSLDLTLDNLNGGNFCPPMKADGYNRMKKSSLQLIKGSVLLLNNRTGIALNNVVNHLDETGQSTIRAITSIASTQSVLYSFGPYCHCKFDADYRVISLSPISSSDLIPCELKMKVNGAFVSRQLESSKQDVFPSDLAEKLRYYFIRCRSIHNVSFSPEICERAEQSFIKRRANARSDRYGTDVTETDFHRWLTLVRLQARSRYSSTSNCANCEANNQDWEMALQLDDAMRATFHSVQVSPARTRK